MMGTQAAKSILYDMPAPRTYAKSPSMLAISWWFAILGVIIGTYIAGNGWGLEGGALAVLGFAPLYLSLDRKLTPELLIGPCMMAYLYHGTGYALGPLAQRYLIGYIKFAESGFVLAQRGAVIGLLTFAIVYTWVFQGDCSSSSSNRNRQGLVLISEQQWKQYSLALLAWSIFIIVFGFTTGTQRRLAPANVSILMKTVVAMFIWARIVVWFFLGYCARRFGSKWFWLWFWSIIIYSAYVFLDGSRGWVAFAFLMSANGVALAGVSTKKLWIGLMIFALISSPFAAIVSDYRQDYRGGDSSILDRIAHFQSTAEEYSAGYGAGEIGAINLVLLQSTAHTVDRIFVLTPGIIPFAGFSDLERIVYIFLPRAVLPDRPNLQTGGETACLYAVASGMAQRDDPRCGVGEYTPTVGEGYRRFGWIGVPLMYALLAVVYGLVIRLVWARRSQAEWGAMLVVIMMSATGIWSTGLLDIFYRIGWEFPKYFLFCWIVRWLLDKLGSDKYHDMTEQKSAYAMSLRGQ